MQPWAGVADLLACAPPGAEIAAAQADALAMVLVAAVELWEWIAGDSDDYDWQ